MRRIAATCTGQRYDFELLAEGGPSLWRWSHGRGFIQMLGQETLAPGQRLEYREPIALPATPGRYRLVGVLTSASHLRRVEVAIVVEGG